MSIIVQEIIDWWFSLTSPRDSISKVSETGGVTVSEHGLYGCTVLGTLGERQYDDIPRAYLVRVSDLVLED